MNAIHKALVSIHVGVLMLTGTGCTALRPIHVSADPSAPMYSHLESGDEVVLYLRAARRVEIVIKLVEPDAIVAKDGTRYGRDHITRAEVRAVSGRRVALITVASVVGGFLILLIGIASSECYPYCS